MPRATRCIAATTSSACWTTATTGTVALTRAYTAPSFRGHGYAGDLVDRAVSALEHDGARRVLPVCWYVADWFAANPGRGEILADRRSA